MDDVAAAIRELLEHAGSTVEMGGPIGVADRARVAAAAPALPEEYLAALACADGLAAGGFRLLGSRDWLEPTELAGRAREFLADSARFDDRVAGCLPIANLGQPNDWLLYDPDGELREGGPGFFVRLTADDCPVDGLADAIHRHVQIVLDV